MASTQPVVVLPPNNLFPLPLHIRKKPRRASRRATFYRRIVRKPPQQSDRESVCGPLDDIITEISSDIWALPVDAKGLDSVRYPRIGEPAADHTWSLESAFHELVNPLAVLGQKSSDWKAASTCTVSTVTPLPVSRIPSDQPLSVRKTRSSRSTASGSSATPSIMAHRSSSSKNAAAASNGRGTSDDASTAWPSLDSSPAQQALEEANQVAEPKRRPSRIRLFPNGFTRLLRSGSDAKGAGLGGDGDIAELPDSGDADEASVDAKVIDAKVKQEARGLPSPLGNRHTDAIGELSPYSTTLKPMINLLSEVKLLGPEQEFWVAVEIEGVLHNRRELTDPSLDVVFVIDNGYYVSKDCLAAALDTATGALHQLGRGDRVALYTTHCTHGPIASTVPDRLLPLRPVCPDTEEVFRDLTMDISKHGIQKWDPPRPTPPMTSVILAIARSMEHESPKHGRCHIILLSPIFDMLHTVSETFPRLHIHQVSPAVLPYIPDDEHRKMVCTERCCKKVFVSNWTHYQSGPGRIKQIIFQARSKNPVGSITDVHVDLRPRRGCEVLEIDGPTTVSTLRPGQAFSFLARLRVTSTNTEELGAASKDPLLDYSLDATTLRQELYIANKLGAKLAHLLSVQVFHKYTWNPPGTWSYSEAPLAAISKLGGLAQPHDLSLEVYKRRIFHRLNKVDNETAKKEVDGLAMSTIDDREGKNQVVQRMAKEIHWRHAVLEYEESSRKKLPLCTGPIEIASAENHEHIQAIAAAKMNKRKGMAVM